MKTEAKQFYVHEVMKYGLDRAILINYFRVFISGNKASGRHQHDGLTYTHNTHKEIAARHPWWNKQKVGRMVRSLVDEGVLVVAHLSENRWDRTSYFAFADEAKFLPDHVITGEPSHDITSETSDDITSEPSYTKESLKSPKEYVDRVIEYYESRGLTPTESELLAHEFLAYWDERGGGPTPEKFKRHAATWLTQAKRFGKINTKQAKLTKAEFLEMQGRLHTEGKKFDPTGWKLVGEYWTKEA